MTDGTHLRTGWTAVVLAGGRASRLGGRTKPQLVIDGRALLAHLIDGLPAEVPIVVVGPEQPVPRPVVFRREEPVFGGPVAALAAALDAVDTSALALVGGDMPYAGLVLSQLAAEWSGEEAIVPVDQTGRRQLLCSVLSTHAVGHALAELGDPAGRSVRGLLDRLAVVERPLSPEDSALLRDIDTPADLGGGEAQ